MSGAQGQPLASAATFPSRFEFIQTRTAASLIILFFGVYFFLIGGVNHLFHHSNAMDHGYYLNAVYKLSRLELSSYTLAPGHFSYTWGDHFEPSLALIAPFRYIFGTYVLVLLQILFILIGGLGVGAWILHKHSNERLANLSMAHFLGLWGIQAAVAFDFHMSVVGTMLIPWLLLTFERKQWTSFVPLLVFFWGCSETFGFWGALLGIGLGIAHVRDRQLAIAAMLVLLGSVAYFIWVHKLIIPEFLKPGHQYAHFKFKAFGDDLGSALTKMVFEPWQTAKALFTNHTGHPSGANLKIQFCFMLALSGGAFMLIRPSFAMMTIPLLLVKMLSDKAGSWGLSYHYSVVFMPFVTMAGYDWIGRRLDRRWAVRLAIFWPALVLVATLTTVTWRSKQESMSDCNLFDPSHWYQEDYCLRQGRKAMELIPDDAVVAASNSFVPSLAFRDSVSLYPHVWQNTEYILILRQGDIWPENARETEQNIQCRFLDHVWWEIQYDSSPVLLLRNRVVSRNKGRKLERKIEDRRLSSLE